MLLQLAPVPDKPTGGITGWALDLIETFGGLGIMLLSALDSMISIIPADLVLPMVGYSATRGVINLGTAIACATAGSVTGSVILYALAARLGRDRARALLTKLPGVTSHAFDRAEAWFARHGAKAVVLGRLLPGVRTFISLPAGVERMPLPKFTALTAIGNLTWNSTLLISGYLLGENWQQITDAAGIFQYLALAALVLAVTHYLRKRGTRRRASPELQ